MGSRTSFPYVVPILPYGAGFVNTFYGICQRNFCALPDSHAAFGFFLPDGAGSARDREAKKQVLFPRKT